MDVPIQSSNIFSNMVIIGLQNMNVARYNEQKRITYNKCVWMCGGGGTTHQMYLGAKQIITLIWIYTMLHLYPAALYF